MDSLNRLFNSEKPELHREQENRGQKGKDQCVNVKVSEKQITNPRRDAF